MLLPTKLYVLQLDTVAPTHHVWLPACLHTSALVWYAQLQCGIAIRDCLQVRELLVAKKQKLIRALKDALSRVPRRIIAAVSAKFLELDKRLRQSPTNIEEVADQRQFVDSLPRKVNELVAEMEAAQVCQNATVLSMNRHTASHHCIS